MRISETTCTQGKCTWLMPSYTWDERCLELSMHNLIFEITFKAILPTVRIGLPSFVLLFRSQNNLLLCPYISYNAKIGSKLTDNSRDPSNCNSNPKFEFLYVVYLVGSSSNQHRSWILWLCCGTRMIYTSNEYCQVYNFGKMQEGTSAWASSWFTRPAAGPTVPH